MARIVPFEAEHIAGAAALVLREAAAARRRHPLVGGGLEDPGRVAGLLAGPATNGLGVAAVAGRRVVGFLLPLPVDLWGAPGAYVPEWGRAGAEGPPAAETYAAAAARWVAAGRRTHAVTLWAHEPETEAAWHDLGFGRVVVDAVRGLEPTARRARLARVRPASRGDASTLAALERGLWEHLAAAPVFRVHPRPGRAEAVRRLADPAQPVWLAEMAGSPVGFLSLQPGDEAPAALRLPGLVRCDGAYVLAGARGRGVGFTLLGAALRWAAAAGFAGCSLDFESANAEAAGFWPAAGFAPVLHSIARQV
jgi:GNAT superfamily N-acetyltransferase